MIRVITYLHSEDLACSTSVCRVLLDMQGLFGGLINIVVTRQTYSVSMDAETSPKMRRACLSQETSKASGKARPKAKQNWTPNNTDRLVSLSTSNGFFCTDSTSNQYHVHNWLEQGIDHIINT